jgi:hypothetical protein
MRKHFRKIGKIKSLSGIGFFIGLFSLLTGCWLINIDTPYYTQTTSYYCGAASAQMVLDSENLGIYVSPQSDIYNYIHAHNICGGWASDPEGLKDGLNHFVGGAAYFSWYAPSDQDAGNNKLAYTLDHYEVPPVALVYGSAHWIVVRGVFTDVQPTSSGSYDLYGFYVNDPWYGSSTLGEDRYIDARTWNDEIFTGGSWCGSPGGKFISVVDPDPPTQATPVYAKRLEKQAEIINPKKIREMAADLMKNVTTSELFLKVFDPETVKLLSIAKVGTPRLTRRLDKKEEAYFIVPLLAANCQLSSAVQGAVLFDAYRGELKEVSAVARAVSYAAVDNQDYALSVFKKAYDLARNRVREITGFELVWMPSAQSRSPFQPLWEAKGVRTDSKTPVTLGYMDLNGKIFNRVTSLEDAKLKGGGF